MSNEVLQKLVAEAEAQIRSVQDGEALKLFRSAFMGKKGTLAELSRGMRELSPEDKKTRGQEINEARQAIARFAEGKERELEEKALEAQLEAGRVDVTMPGRRHVLGLPHPLRRVMDEIVESLSGLGFQVVDGPQTEHEWYNFDALNMPASHPARDMQDTFYLGPNTVMRTQTSNIQIREMEKRKPPLRILAPGMVFRNDDIDPTHSPVFHQIEGLWVDDRVTFADLKGVLRKFTMDMFGANTKIRFRPSYFPFTEPSTEVDCTCVACQGKGCRLCKHTGWLEILGAGMVNPAVFDAVGYNRHEVQGFAFGAGIERIAMLRWGVPDIRLFYENDLRFLKQFGRQTVV